MRAGPLVRMAHPDAVKGPCRGLRPAGGRGSGFDVLIGLAALQGLAQICQLLRQRPLALRPGLVRRVRSPNPAA